MLEELRLEEETVLGSSSAPLDNDLDILLDSL
jgi:hypothetical protein